MSADDITAILLPASRVDFYAIDDATVSLAEKLKADWRFARVGLQIERTGIEGAIAHYTQVASPELIIVETNDISDAFIQTLGQLAGVCAAGTDAVVIGPKNDVHLYRSLVEMGIKDYLVRPVSETDMVKVIARTLVDKRGLSSSRLVSVIGSKGGVGTTAVAQAIAWNIAQNLKQKTILMDVVGSAGGVGIAFGLEPAASFPEAVRIGSSGSEDDLKRICQSVSDSLSVMVCGGEPILTDSIDADHIEALVNRLMQKYPVVVVDLSHATPPVQKRLLARSVEIALVTTPVLSALRNARTLMSEVKSLKGNLKDISLIVNMQGAAGSEEVPLRDFKEVMGVEPAVTIPHLPKVFVSSEATGKPVGQTPGGANVLESLMALSARAAAVENKGSASGGKKEGGFFKKVLGK